MTLTIDRNPEGRDIGEGEDRTAAELLMALLVSIERLRVGMIKAGYAEDVDNLDDLDLAIQSL